MRRKQSCFPKGMTYAIHSLLAALVIVAVSGVLRSSFGAETRTVLSGTVERVIDGDTLDVLLDSGTIRIRLNAIDAPEAKQPGGPEATAYLSNSVLHKVVEVEPISQDRYRRMIAIIFENGQNINHDLVKHGYAWAFRKYMNKSDAALCDSEYSARKAKLGLWSLKPADVISPWEFRKRKELKSFTDYSNESSADCIAKIGNK